MVTTPSTEQPAEDGSYSPEKANPLREIFNEQVRLHGKEQVVGTALELMGVESRAQFLAEHFPETVKVAAFAPQDEQTDLTTAAGEVHALVARRGVDQVLEALLNEDKMLDAPGAIDLGGLVARIGRARGYREIADAAMNLLSVEALAQLLGTKYVKPTRRAAELLPKRDQAETAWDLLESNGVHLDEWIRSLDGPDQDTALGQLQQLYIERMLLGPTHDSASITHWLKALGKRYDAVPVARDAFRLLATDQQLEVLATASPTVLGQALKKLSGPGQARLLTLLQHEVKKSGPEGVATAVRRVTALYDRVAVAKAVCGDLSTAEGRELLKSWNPADPILDGLPIQAAKRALDLFGTGLVDILLNQLDDDTVVPIILRRLDVVPNEPEGTEKRTARQEVEEALLAAMFRPKPGQVMTLESPDPKWLHPMAAYKVVLRLNPATVLHEGLQLPVNEMSHITRVTVPVVQEDGGQYELVRCYVHHVEYVPAVGDLPEQRVLVVDREDIV